MANKRAQVPIPKGFEAGETYYEVTAKTSYYKKPEPIKPPKATRARPYKMPPMEVRVVGAVKVQGNRR